MVVVKRKSLSRSRKYEADIFRYVNALNEAIALAEKILPTSFILSLLPPEKTWVQPNKPYIRKLAQLDNGNGGAKTTHANGGIVRHRCYKVQQ